MFVFLVAALLAYAVVAAGALAIGGQRKAGPPRLAATTAALVAVGLYSLFVWRVVDLDFLESARNFQLLLGTLFGALVWSLPRADRLATRLGSTASGEGGATPWWTRPSAMVALALLALPLVALIAPHGRLDLGLPALGQHIVPRSPVRPQRDPAAAPAGKRAAGLLPGRSHRARHVARSRP